MRNDRHFDCRMQDEHISVGAGFTHFHRRAVAGGIALKLTTGFELRNRKSHYMYTNVRWRNSNSYKSGVAGYGIVKTYIWTFIVYLEF